MYIHTSCMNTSIYNSKFSTGASQHLKILYWFVNVQNLSNSRNSTTLTYIYLKLYTKHCTLLNSEWFNYRFECIHAAQRILSRVGYIHQTVPFFSFLILGLDLVNLRLFCLCYMYILQQISYTLLRSAQGRKTAVTIHARTHLQRHTSCRPELDNTTDVEWESERPTNRLDSDNLA